MTNERRKALFPALRAVLVVCLLVPVAAPTHAEALEAVKGGTYDIDLILGRSALQIGDYVKALRLFRIAAEKGKISSGLAQYSLGLMYDEGQGVPQDYAEAVKWYRKAAEQGHARAQNNLGAMYYKGRGVPQDYAEAHMWFNLAASRFPPGEDRDKAVENRDLLAEKMTPAQISKAQKLAREWKPKK